MRKRVGVLAGVAGVAGWLTCTIAVRADEPLLPTARFVWVTAPPPGCVDVGRVHATVEARLGRQVFVAAPDSLLIEAHFEQRGTSWVVELETRSPDGERLGARVLSASDCDELGATLPVVIAVLLDLRHPEGEGALPPSDPDDVPRVMDRAPEPERPAPAAFSRPAFSAAPRPPRLEEPTGVVAFTVGPTGGRQPELAFEGMVEGTVSLVFPLEAAMWLGGRLPSSTGGAPAVSLWSVSATLGGCAAAALSVGVRPGVCAGGGVVLLRASGENVPKPDSDTRAVPELRLEAAVDLAIAGPLWARIAVGGAAPLTRPSYGYFDGSGDWVELFHPGLDTFGRAGLAVHWR